MELLKNLIVSLMGMIIATGISIGVMIKGWEWNRNLGFGF